MLSGKTQIKITALLIASIMLCAGCASNKGEDHEPENIDAKETATGINMVSEDGSWQGDGGCYKLALPDLKVEAAEIYTDGEEFYALNYNFSNNSVSMEIFLGEEKIYQTSNITRMALGKSGIWTLEDVTDYSVGNDRIYHLLRSNSAGEPFETDVTPYIEDSFPRAMRTDCDGQLYIMLADRVIVIDEEGTYLGEIDMEAPNKLIVGSDGKMYVQSGEGDVVFRLDASSKTAVQAATFPGFRICDGGENYLFTLVRDDGLYGVRKTGGEAEPIALWAELGFSFANLYNVQFMSEGRFLLKDHSGTYILRPADPSEIRPKTTLTMASVRNRSPLERIVMNFNLSSNDYVVKIIDYSKAGNLSTEEAILNLNKDIISGNYPDLFDFTGLTESYYADKGLVADLYEFMDQDSDVGRDDFVLLNKMETGGKLFYAASHYYIETAAGLWSRFGDRHGWSLDEYLEIQSQYSGEVMYNITRENFLRTLAYRYVVSAVDWEAGTCNFETEEFIKILETVANIRENPESENPAELDFTPGGKRLSQGTLIVCLWYVSSVRTLAEAEQEAGEKLSFMGWPTSDGSSGNRIDPSCLTGICTRGDQEGAWNFIKYLLTEGGQNYADYGISVNRAVLEAQIEEAMIPSETEEGLVTMDLEDMEQLYKLLEYSNYYGTAAVEVVNIVLEEASVFFAGAKSAEATAHVIQSRVGLLVAE